MLISLSKSFRRATSIILAFLLVAVLTGPAVSDGKTGKSFIPTAHAEDIVTIGASDVAEGESAWGALQAAVFAGGYIQLTSDFFNDEVETSDNHSVFNVYYYSLEENGGVFPKYPGLGPLLVVEDTVLDLNGHTLKREFYKSGYHSCGMVIIVRNGAKLTIVDSSSDNSGVITGAMNKGRSSSSTWEDMSDSSVSIQYQDSYGGGIYVEDGSLVLKGGTVKDNKCSYMTSSGNGGLGGGVYVSSGASCSIYDPARITGNEAVNGYGGGICSDEGATVMVEDEDCVSGNKSPKDHNDNIHFNSETMHHEFTVKFVLEDDLTTEVADSIIGTASDGATISSSDVEDPNGFTYTDHLLGRGEGSSLTVSPNTEQNVLFIKYKKLTPTATVTDVTAPTGVRVYNLDLTETEYIVNVESAKKFTADSVTQKQYDFYKDWHCDFAVSFNQDVDPGSFGLYGKYGDFDIAFVYPETADVLPAGEKIYLLSSLLGSSDLCTYEFIHDVVKDFTCGVFNLTDENVAAAMTVELVIWPAEGTPDDAYVVESFDYEILEKTTLRKYPPDYPTATVEEVTAPTNVPIGTLSGAGEDEYVEAIGSAYKFVAVEPDEEQFDYYQNWRCDYLLSFDKGIDAGTFGLYGNYGNYGDIAFVVDSEISAGTELLLMESLGDPINYQEFVNDIDTFTCGAFNLAEENFDTTMTVRLVIWNPSAETPEYIDLCEAKTYDFSDLTEVKTVAPEYPQAVVTPLTPAPTEVPVFVDGAPNGDKIDIVENAVIFTVDENITEEQIAYYGNWLCDFRVTFADDIDANSFGLYGAYGEYNRAILFADAIEAGDSYLLLRDFLGEDDYTFNDILTLVQEFRCGAFNLDPSNKDKTMTVELILWPADGNPDDAYIVEAFDYDFNDLATVIPELPEAEMNGVDAPVGVMLYDTNGNALNASVDIGVANEFVALEVTEAQMAYYANWHCDFAVSFDSDIEAGSFGLYGAYGEYQRAFLFPAVSAGNRVLLLETILNDGDLCTYYFIKNMVGSFTCGSFNLDESNKGKTMTVQLIMWPENGLVDDAVVIAEYEYTFDDITMIIPDAPTATVTNGDAATLVDVLNSLSVVAEINDVYTFTADEPSEAQYDYYKDWRCDYIISFSEPVATSSFGFYGKYDQYKASFITGIDFSADSDFLLMEQGLNNPCDYKEILNNVNAFSCAAFNLDEANKGTEITVRLVIWDGSMENPEYIDLCEPVTYTFGDPTELLGPYTVTVSSESTAGTANIATVEGGGDYKFGSEVTVTANDKDGYNFKGWYKDSYSVDNLFSANQSETITAIDSDYTLIAVYEPIKTGGNLYVYGFEYTVNGSSVQSGDSVFQIKYGQSATISYQGEDFLYWVNASGNIISTSAEFTFTFVADATVKLITSREVVPSESAYVVFMNAYNQVLAEGRITDEFEAEELFPDYTPSKVGMTFDKWIIKGTKTEATPEAIAEMCSDQNPVVTVVPSYNIAVSENFETTYTVNVFIAVGSILDQYNQYTVELGKSLTIDSSDISAMCGLEHISYWSDDNGNILSYDSVLIIRSSKAGEEYNIFAVYCEDVEVKPLVNIIEMYGTYDNDNYKVNTTLQYAVPAPYTYYQSGFVFTTNADYANEENLVLNSGLDAVRVHVTGLTASSGIYTMFGNLKNNADKVLYMRAYVIYADEEGNLSTLYSDIWSGSYNSLEE